MPTVRKIRDAEESRKRVWIAAASAFATRGFDGAKVDEIAKDAGINKAMVYYHFADKLTLYRAILQDMFSAVALATTDVRTTGGAPEQQLRGYVGALIRAAEERPHFPAIWLREIAEEGRHLDEGIFSALRSVLANLTGILTDGVTAGVWRRVDPFLVQAGVAAPVMLVLATRRVRQRAGIGTADGTLEALVDHVTTMTLATLTLDGRSPS